MVKHPSYNSRYNSKVFANNLSQNIALLKALNLQHQRIFNTFSNILVSTSSDPNLEVFSRTRTTPMSKFGILVFVRRLQLLQKVCIRDVRQTFKNYNEKYFSQQLKVLTNRKQPQGTYPRDQFLTKFPFRSPPEVISLLELQRRTKHTDSLPTSHPEKPKLASSRIKTQIDKF